MRYIFWRVCCSWGCARFMGNRLSVFMSYNGEHKLRQRRTLLFRELFMCGCCTAVINCMAPVFRYKSPRVLDYLHKSREELRNKKITSYWREGCFNSSEHHFSIFSLYCVVVCFRMGAPRRAAKFRRCMQHNFSRAYSTNNHIYYRKVLAIPITPWDTQPLFPGNKSSLCCSSISEYHVGQQLAAKGSDRSTVLFA